MTEALSRLQSARRDPELVREVAKLVARLAAGPCLQGRELALMEVCGTHTMSVHRYGLKKLLPPSVHLISGPGCPVCVTPAPLLAQALALARYPNVIITSFGDMLRVPLAGDSLLKARDNGADVRLVTSPLAALELARRETAKQVVFVAVGFETTSPLTAATLQLAARQGVDNFSILAAHRLMPPALHRLMQVSDIDGLLCPGHVAALTGARYFEFVPRELHKPAAVAGFEPLDIMEAVLALLMQLAGGECRLENAYARAVPGQANATAMAAMYQVFEAADAAWRGLGDIPGSGLKLRQPYASFDAAARFGVADITAADNPACRCGAVLAGSISPRECPLFGKVCNPESPEGACMVSSEGACSAEHKYL